MRGKPWNSRKRRLLTLRIASPSIRCPHVVETEAEEIGNQTKMADANPTRNHMTISHATVVEIVVEINLIVEEKHPSLPIKPPAEAVEN